VKRVMSGNFSRACFWSGVAGTRPVLSCDQNSQNG
jgi:hypothetical protein